MSTARSFAVAGPIRDSRRLIPFEQSFEFDLQGKGRVLKQSVVVSVEGAFTATSIGYGFVPEIDGLTFGPKVRDIPIAEGGKISFSKIPFSLVLKAADDAFAANPAFGRRRPASEAVARIGIQLNPDFAHAAIQDSLLDQSAVGKLFRVVGTDSADLLFRYALFDQGTGRAFQSDPVLNIAGLGTSNGERPFRHFNPPIVFERQTTISLEVTEVSNHVGQLFISLQGYKVLGESGTPTDSARHDRHRGRRR